MRSQYCALLRTLTYMHNAYNLQSGKHQAFCFLLFLFFSFLLSTVRIVVHWLMLYLLFTDLNWPP